MALGLLGGLGLAAAATFYRVSPASPLFYPAWFLAQAWLLGWYGAAVAAIDEMAPPGLRASVLGLGLLVVNLVGVASGAYLTGLVGDRASLTVGLTWSLAPAALGAALPSSSSASPDGTHHSRPDPIVLGPSLDSQGGSNGR